MFKRTLTKILFLLLNLVVIQSDVSYAYNNTLGLINIPSALNRRSGQLESGVFHYYNSGTSAFYLQNFFLTYAFSDYTEYSLVIYRNQNLGHHIQQKIWSGNISGKPDLEDSIAIGIKDFGLANTTNTEVPILYGIMSGTVFGEKGWEYHYGFKLNNPLTDSQTLSTIKVFYGLQRVFDDARIMIEWDGTQANFGLNFMFGERFGLAIGFIGLMKQEVTQGNELVLGFTYRYELFSEYTSEENNLKAEIAKTKQQLAELQILIDKLPEVKEPTAPVTNLVAEHPDFISVQQYVNATVNVVSPAQSVSTTESVKSTKPKIAYPNILDHLQKGMDYYYLGDLESSIEEYRTVIEIDPNITIAHIRLGSIYFRLGDYKKAEEEWRLAYRLNPEHQELKKFLKYLEGDSDAGKPNKKP